MVEACTGWRFRDAKQSKSERGQAEARTASVGWKYTPSRALIQTTDGEVEAAAASKPSAINQLEEAMGLANTVEFPSNTYGAAMAVAQQWAETSDRNVYGVALLLNGYALLNMVVQFYVIWSTGKYITIPAVAKIRHLYARYHEEVFDDYGFNSILWDDWDTESKSHLCQLPLANKAFFLTIHMIWTTVVMVDIKESAFFIHIWANLPSTRADERDMYTEWDSAELKFVGTKASFRTKAAVIGVVLIPKICIAMLLWLIGSRWLLSTPNFQDLILNGVALAFIMELDEIIYAALVPRDTINWISMHALSVPPAESVAERHRTNTRMMVLKLFLIITIPYVYVSFLQQVLPNYKWDVHDVCERYLAAVSHEQDGAFGGAAPGRHRR